MIQTDVYGKRRDGTVLIRTYSDAGYHITRDGEIYEEAIDPQDSGRVYTETNILVEKEGENDE